MSKYLKLFETTAQYNAYTADTSNFILPNVSVCEDAPTTVYYHPYVCEETSEYEVIGQPTYPSTIDGDATSFEMTVNYRRTDTNTACTETVTEGTDTVTVEIGVNPSTSSTRTVSGTVDYHGNEIEYSVTQSKYVLKIRAKFNVTDTSNPTKIVSSPATVSSIEIDGVEQQSVTTGYTFSTLGEHTVKYTFENYTQANNTSFSDCRNLTNVEIQSGVTSIGDYAFKYCSSLTSIDIPDSVTSIGDSAFYNCNRLTSIDIPDSVTSIGQRAFYFCNSLTSIDIPDSVTSIGYGVFSDCRSLTSIDIPDSVTSIGDSAFYNCKRLTSIDIPDSVTSIGSSAFTMCYITTSNFVNNSSLDEVTNNYWNCTIVDSEIDGLCIKDNSVVNYRGNTSAVIIPDNVTSIGDRVFESCTELTSCTIGSGVTSIGSYAFRYCTRLTSIIVETTTPPELGWGAFENTNECPIYVPSNTVDVYKTTGYWTMVASRIQPIA